MKTATPPPPHAPTPVRLLVDGMNVIGATPDGWWRDRDAAVLRLVERLRRLAAARDFEVTLVLDGRPPAALPEGAHRGIEVVYGAGRGRNAADDRIVELLTRDPAPASWLVVTSDRALRARVEARGASVRGVSWLVGLLEELASA